MPTRLGSRFCSLLLFALLAASAAHAASFTIPAPGGLPPVSQVRIRFEFSSAVGGTAQIAMSDGATAVLGAGLVSTNGTDKVGLFSVSGDPNKADFVLIANSMLNDPADYCTPKGGAGATTYTFTMSNFPAFSAATDGYRMTGYSGVAGSTYSCHCRNRRVKTVVWNTPPGGNNLGRLPMDLILVLDRSGSMGITDSSGLTRWQSLVSAAGGLVGAWETEGLTAGTTGGTSLGKDRLGLTYFSTGAQPFPGPGLTLFTRDSGSWDSVRTDPGIKGPDQLTALGQGIAAGLNAWQVDKHDTVMLVMSDGIQNVDPQVNDGANDAGYTAAGLKVLQVGAGNANRPLADWCVPMLTVSLGSTLTPSSYDALLDAISMQTSGAHRQATAGTVTQAFITSLVEALKGNTLSTAAELTGTSVGPAIDHVVRLDKTIHGAIAVLSWNPASAGALWLQVLDPNGQFYPPPNTIASRISLAGVSGPGYRIRRADVPPSGNWTFRVGRDASGAIPYTLTVLTEEKSLDLDLGFRGIKHPTGDPLVIDGLVSFDGKAVDNGVLRVAAQTPAGAFGSILHDDVCTPECSPDKVCANKSCIALPAGGAPGQDAPEPLEFRINSMGNNPGFGTKDAGTLTLTSQGGGRYTVSLGDTRTPGKYGFLLALDWTTPDGEQVHRQHYVEARVEVIADPGASTIGTKAVGSGLWDVTVDPRDKFGNWVGPGYHTRLHVSTAGGATVAPRIDDPKLTGSYVAHLSNVTGDPVVTVGFGEVQIKQAPLSRLPQGDGGPFNCAHCKSSGAFLFMLAGLLLARRRRRR